ncbi:hypothetical protein NLY33_09390 [Mesorhizobium sp. C432A]|uniref:hypothetical protein n=1 Tax=Mesorhizobium sp. C432A TaxID=2956836 RepID=UPI0025776B94|nr:hypothetical protein [Mesorhizobium sp. C432A]WJI58908.1 hypothetical protein NLY33_09390 [Mesorhizobium sp. C432A]
MTIDHTTAKVLTNLLRELSSELDLHHEDDEFPALKATIETLRCAATLMTDAGHKTLKSTTMSCAASNARLAPNIAIQGKNFTVPRHPPPQDFQNDRTIRPLHFELRLSGPGA